MAKDQMDSKDTRVMTLNGTGTIVGRIIENEIVTKILVKHDWMVSTIPILFAYPTQFVWPIETAKEALYAAQ